MLLYSALVRFITVILSAACTLGFTFSNAPFSQTNLNIHHCDQSVPCRTYKKYARLCRAIRKVVNYRLVEPSISTDVAFGIDYLHS